MKKEKGNQGVVVLFRGIGNTSFFGPEMFCCWAGGFIPFRG